jgi:truncated hemoglobin YjbI
VCADLAKEKTMSDLQSRFIEHIKLRALGDRFIDKAEEKEILIFAINEGVELNKAKAALRNAVLKLNYVLESYVEERGRASLIKSLEDAQVDKDEFDAAVKIMRETSQNMIDEDDCRRRLKKIVIDGNVKIREGFLKGGNWFSKIPD